MSLSSLARALAGLCAALAALALIAVVALNFVNVLGRYAFSAPIAWAEEIMLYLMIAGVFLGACRISWDNRHIRMEAVHVMPAWMRRPLALMAELAAIVVGAIYVFFSVPVIEKLARFGQKSQAAEFPMAVAQGVIPLCLGLMIVFGLIRLLTGGTGTESAAAEPSGES